MMNWPGLTKRLVSGVALFALLGPGVSAQAPAVGQGPDRTERMRRDVDNLALQRVAPFKAFDDLHYVGAGWVGSWLVTTSDGLILLDALARPVHVDRTLDGVRLGFDPKSIKCAVITQAHADHYAGEARLQTQVAMGETDWRVVEARPTGASGAATPGAPRRDRVVGDGVTLALGDTTLTLVDPRSHPGTTSVDVAVFGQKVETLQNGVQVRIVNHPWMDTEFWDRVDRVRVQKAAEPNPFVEAQVSVRGSSQWPR